MSTQAPHRAEPAPVEPPAGEPGQVNRRSVLRGLAVGGTTLVVAGTGAASFRVFETRALEPATGRAYDAWGQWQDPGPLGLVSAAILAANAHNAQAWRFAVTGSGVDLFADLSRNTGTVDGRRRELYVGLGCAVENLVLAAAPRGYSATLTLLPDGSAADGSAADGAEPIHVAHVALARGAAPVPSSLYPAIGHRHSNRGPYSPRPVAADVRAALGAHALDLDGVDVHWVSTSAELAAMGRLMVDAAHAVVADEQQSRDAFAWYRSTAAAIERHQDGLTLDGQGLSAMMTALGQLLPASSRTAGDTFWLTQTRTVHTRTAAAYGVITVPSAADPRHRLNGGRLLQRIHLDVTGRGLGLQHMNQITERIDRESLLGLTPTFAPRLAGLLGPDSGQPLVSFRIGHPVRTPRRSPRRPAAQVQQS